jgi:hypothetical protein
MTAQSFWNWFERHHFEFLISGFGSAEGRQRLLDKLNHQLHQYSNKLIAEFSVNSEQEVLVEIGANADVNYFTAVEALIGHAPEIEGFRFIAFMQPRGFEFQMRYKQFVIDPNTVWFYPRMSRSSPATLGIWMGYREFDDSKTDDFWNASWEILVYGLGERQAALDIKRIEVLTLPEDPEAKNFIPLVDLPGYINWWKECLLKRNAQCVDIDGALIGSLGGFIESFEKC